MLRKALDTNIIVYSLLEDHPASQVCDALIRSGRYDFHTTPLTPFEVYFALRRAYSIPKEEASEKALSLFDSPLTFAEIGTEDARTALKRCVAHDLDANDSLLIQACLRSNIPSLTTDDKRLLKASEENGILPQTPIEEEHRKKMRQWEADNLPPSGLPRLLRSIHSWLEDTNTEIAREFLDATKGLRGLPL